MIIFSLFSTPFTLIDGKTSKKFHVFWNFFNFILLYFASGVNSGNYTYIILIKLSTVSGDISGISIKAKEVYVDTVSGDMGCNVINCDNLGLSSVSGDFNIAYANANIKASSVSGDIIVNSQNVGVNVKKTIKGLFR